MVILQFNKLIRNKWIWGAFAVVVSVAFCSDGCFRDTKAEAEARDYGKLGDAAVDAELFDLCRADVEFWYHRGNRDLPSSTELNKQAWKLYAAQKVAERNGIAISDESVARYAGDFLRSQGVQGDLDPAAFEKTVRDGLRMTTARYEAFCRRALVAQAVGLEGYPPVGARKAKESDRDYQMYVMRTQYTYGMLMQMRSVSDAAVWVSPMEVEQALYDETDKFTVRVANFVQTEEEAAAVKVDDATLKAWYDENKESVKLPDIRQVKFVKFDAALGDEDIAKETVAEDDIAKYYDSHFSSYKTTTTYPTNKTDLASIVAAPNTTAVTNDDKVVVTVTKPLDAVQGDIKKILAQQQIVRNFKKVMVNQVFAPLADGETAEARLEALAKPGNRKVETSGWFAAGSEPVVEGFMVSKTGVIPGVADLATGLAQLKMSTKDPLDRFTVVNSEKAVYVLVLAAEQKSHIPSFDEAKGKIGRRVREAEQAKAFKAKVDAVIAKGKDAVLATSDVSTNMTFTVNDQSVSTTQIRMAAQGLKKGEISELIPTGTRKASVVVCLDRAAGDAVSVLGAEDQTYLSKEYRLLGGKMREANGWGESYLNRVGFTPSRQNLVLKSSAKDE